MSEEKKVLAIFDGGNAPGYTAVATSLCEEGEKRGYQVWAAFEGFRSLTSSHQTKERLIRLVMSRRESFRLNAEGIATRSLYRAVGEPGSEFRAERFPQFVDPQVQQEAAAMVKAEGFSHLIGVGGNGTLMGIKALEKLLPGVITGFINVSVDSDILGDIAVGYLTGAEEGARIARGLFDDAYTHKRIYILEMMGRDSGKHALMAGAAARAHLIVLPGFKLTEQVIADVAARLASVDHALIVVAEGYQREERAKFLPDRVDAALYLKRQLVEAGLPDTPLRRVISEPFSRYLRGIRPLGIECAIAYLKAFRLYDAFDEGKSRIMPYYLGEHDMGVLPFDDLATNNRVAPGFLDLIDRLVIPSLRDYVSGPFMEGDEE